MRKLITTKRPITFSLLFPGATYHRSPAINFSGDHCRPRPRPRALALVSPYTRSAWIFLEEVGFWCCDPWRSDSTVWVRSKENSFSRVRWHGIRRNGQQWCGSFSRLPFLLNFWDEFGLGLGLVFGVVL